MADRGRTSGSYHKSQKQTVQVVHNQSVHVRKQAVVDIRSKNRPSSQFNTRSSSKSTQALDRHAFSSTSETMYQETAVNKMKSLHLSTSRTQDKQKSSNPDRDSKKGLHHHHHHHHQHTSSSQTNQHHHHHHHHQHTSSSQMNQHHHHHHHHHQHTSSSKMRATVGSGPQHHNREAPCAQKAGSRRSNEAKQKKVVAEFKIGDHSVVRIEEHK